MLRDNSHQTLEYQTLENAPIGTKRVIRLVEGDEMIQARLCELGFIVGAQIELIARGLLGSPYVFRIHRTTVALRSSEVRCLKV